MYFIDLRGGDGEGQEFMIVTARRRTEKERRYVSLRGLPSLKCHYKIPLVREFTYQLFGKMIFNLKNDLNRVYQQHRTQKTALRTKLSKSNTWIDELPTVLLSPRATLGTDAEVNPAEATTSDYAR
ncbi:hypothetical protein EVAR_22683_1 [Eumeta japonica]|uniref:Uncharacterized protein n=1 Tax=Eumeta variegata TaxID=151549 RepID=A0A4C1US67_EUMVA|nr:hypothetical protein EVAR_22683_1 [Eumeta japonica]